MKKRLPQIATWAIALLLTARITWSAHQHGLTVLETGTIAVSVLYATRVGAQHVVDTFQAARRTGAAR